MSEDTKSSNRNIATKILCGIGTIVVAIVCYYFWVNSHAFEGDFFGMTFQMPLERTEHYCSRKAERILSFDTSAYQSCLSEASSTSKRHSSLVNYLMNLFKDDKTNKTVITTSQAECMAKKIEVKLTDSQIDELIKGKAIGDQLGASTGMQIMNDVMQCVK